MNLENTKQFIELFNFTPNSNYYNPIILTDEEIGFSIKRKYPDNTWFKPPVKENGEPDEVLVIWLVYNLPQVKRDQQLDKIPVFIKINKYSLYRTKYFDYNFEDHDSPTEASVLESKKSSQPLYLEYINEFFYYYLMKSFVDKKGKEYTGIEMLDYIVKQHLNTVHIIRSIRIRFKLFAQSIFVGSLGTAISSLTYILQHFFGRILENSDSELSLWHGFKSEEMKRLSTDVMDIFGYRASKQVIYLFCIFIVFVGILDYSATDGTKYIKFVFNNYFLMLAHSIGLLILLDVFIPNLLFHAINLVVKLRNTIAFRKFRV